MDAKSRFSLTSLLRLWALREVGPDSTPTSFLAVCLSLVWLLLWAAIDWLEALPDPQFLVAGVPLRAWYALALLSLAAFLRRQCNPKRAFEASLLLCLGLVPLPLLLAPLAAPFLTPLGVCAAAIIVLIYSFFYLARGLRAFTGESQRIAAVAGIALLVGFIWLTDSLDVIPDLWAAPEVEEAAADTDSHADPESLLFEQSMRIDRALAAIRPDASANPKAFFLGFAGVGEQKVFAQEIGLASRVLAERYAMDDRVLSLINDERDLERAPLASVSGLKYALRGLATRMNPDRDVLFLAISSHGTQDPAIAVSNSELPLNDLTDEDLAEALSDSGIKRRVTLISACYSGGIIYFFKNPTTFVITTAAAQLTSIRCLNYPHFSSFFAALYPPLIAV